MNGNPFEKFKNAIDEARMDEAAKLRIRSRLEAEMAKQRPVTKKAVFAFPFVPRLRFVSVLAIIILIVFLGGGVAFAAQGSLPGDILYPVKIKITEEIRAALTFSEESSADFAVERVERRLEEAEELAKRGRLNDETKANIILRFEEHFSQAEEKIVDIENSSEEEQALEKATELESVLGIHQEMLTKIAEGFENDEKILSPILDLVDQRKKVIRDRKDLLETRILDRERSDLDGEEDKDNPEEDNTGGGAGGGPDGIATSTATSTSTDQSGDRDEVEICIQVITPARNPETGSIVEFPTPCDVPEGWEVVLPAGGSIRDSAREIIEATERVIDKNL